MDTQDYLEIRVRVPDEHAGEIVVAQVSDLGYDAFYYENGEQKCYIQRSGFDSDALDSALKEISGFMGIELPWEVHEMPKEDWNSEWEKNGFTPIECGSFIVLPHDFGEYDGPLQPIRLHSQMAFGTGHHQTTHMMMQTMQSIAGTIEGARVVDLGCGTAVLAILAARLGASHITAVDIDEVAVRSAKKNIELNGLSFEPVCGDGSILDGDQFDVILANIHRNILIDYMPAFRSALKAGGRLLVSGFLEDDTPAILSAANANGLGYIGQLTRDGWCCMELGIQQ